MEIFFKAKLPDKLIGRMPGRRREFLYWRCNAFVEPMVVPWKLVDAIAKNRVSGESGIRGDRDLYLLEFENGECISGKVDRFGEQTVLLSSKRFPSAEVELRPRQGHSQG